MSIAFGVRDEACLPVFLFGVGGQYSPVPIKAWLLACAFQGGPAAFSTWPNCVPPEVLVQEHLVTHCTQNTEHLQRCTIPNLHMPPPGCSQIVQVWRLARRQQQGAVSPLVHCFAWAKEVRAWWF